MTAMFLLLRVFAVVIGVGLMTAAPAQAQPVSNSPVEDDD